MAREYTKRDEALGNNLLPLYQLIAKNQRWIDPLMGGAQQMPAGAPLSVDIRQAAPMPSPPRPEMAGPPAPPAAQAGAPALAAPAAAPNPDAVLDQVAAEAAKTGTPAPNMADMATAMSLFSQQLQQMTPPPTPAPGGAVTGNAGLAQSLMGGMPGPQQVQAPGSLGQFLLPGR